MKANEIRFVVISDTHGKHGDLVLPKGDAIIHAGDVTMSGTRNEVVDFLNWFSILPYKYKIFIPGNHDFFFEQASKAEIDSIIPPNVIYLNDTGTCIGGINIWGSPVSPWFFDWAFNRQRGEEITAHWKLIPSNTDILITHGPVSGTLDLTRRGENVGCEDLRNAIERIIPKYHICGHIHEAYGERKTPTTNFINASVLDEYYSLVNDPITFSLTGQELDTK